MLRRAHLEHRRADAMSPQTLAKNFAFLVKMYREYNVTSPCQVFNLDASGVSTRTVMRGRAKAALNSKGSINALEVQFFTNVGHFTIMPVISADGKTWTPVSILSGT